MRSGSLRLRVTVVVMVVLVVVLVALIAVVDALFGAATARDQGKIINDRTHLAQQLENQHLPPAELLARLSTGGFVHIRITDPRGVTIGPDTNRMATTPPPRTVTYADGTRITLFFSAETKPQIRLHRLLIMVGAAALIVTALVLALAVRFALSPLDTMTRLARSITSGDRGRRLSPQRTDTELGRAAAAFDDMLDALEGAEALAWASEERIRQFIADAAHELRTPITGVRAIAESMLQDNMETDAAERDRMVVLLAREAQRAGRLVDDMMSLVRIETGLDLQHQPVELRTLAEAEADRIRMLAPRLTVTIDGPQVTVQGDAQRLTQVLANLMDNARQATDGKIMVAISVRTAVGVAEVTVSDNGPGVPASERERIFDRLVRLDKARTSNSGGSGLGLAIARGICQAHGGDLRCEAPPPQHPGAVFRISLPLPTPANTTPL